MVRSALLAAGSTVLALGDSLTSGINAEASAAHPAVLQELTSWHIVNGGISGDTTALDPGPACCRRTSPRWSLWGWAATIFCAR